jgi:hypothetical protein
MGLSGYLSSLPRHVTNPNRLAPPQDTKPNIETGRDFRRHAHRDRPIAPPTASPDTRRGVARPGPAVRSTQDCASPRAVAASRAFFTLRDGDCPGCNWPILGCSSRIFRWGRRGSPGLVQGPTQRISSQLLTGLDDSAGSRQRLNRASISAAGTPACRDFMVHSSAFWGICRGPGAMCKRETAGQFDNPKKRQTFCRYRLMPNFQAISRSLAPGRIASPCARGPVIRNVKRQGSATRRPDGPALQGLKGPAIPCQARHNSAGRDHHDSPVTRFRQPFARIACAQLPGLLWHHDFAFQL